MQYMSKPYFFGGLTAEIGAIKRLNPGLRVRLPRQPALALEGADFFI